MSYLRGVKSLHQRRPLHGDEVVRGAPDRATCLLQVDVEGLQVARQPAEHSLPGSLVGSVHCSPDRATCLLQVDVEGVESL